MGCARSMWPREFELTGTLVHTVLYVHAATLIAHSRRYYLPPCPAAAQGIVEIQTRFPLDLHIMLPAGLAATPRALQANMSPILHLWPAPLYHRCI
jgi:hypothetical protein